MLNRQVTSVVVRAYFFYIMSHVAFTAKRPIISNFDNNRVYVFSKTLYTIMTLLPIGVINL